MNMTARISDILIVATFLFGLLFGTGCGSDAVRAQNYPAQLTSAGPVAQSGMQVTVDYSIRDAEGDDQTLKIELCETTDQGEPIEECFIPAQGTTSDGVTLLPTTPRGTDVPHRFGWAVGCGLGSGECETASLDTEYVFRLSVEDASSEIISPTFTLGELGFSSVPMCSESSTRLKNRPSQCE